MNGLWWARVVGDVLADASIDADDAILILRRGAASLRLVTASMPWWKRAGGLAAAAILDDFAGAVEAWQVARGKGEC